MKASGLHFYMIICFHPLLQRLPIDHRPIEGERLVRVRLFKEVLVLDAQIVMNGDIISRLVKLQRDPNK